MDAQPDSRFVSFLLHWHGVWRNRSGPEGLRRTVAQLQGVSLPASDLESCILRARLADYSPPQLDAMIESGEVVWQGDQALGPHDGQISLFLKNAFPRLGRISVFAAGAREQQLRNLLLEGGALEFERLVGRLGGFPEDILRTLWRLVWHGEASSDSLDALRARRSSPASRYRHRSRPCYATRKRVLPGAAGRWKLLSGPDTGFAAGAERELAMAGQMLDRYGILCRGTLPGFAEWRPLLERLESQGRARRVRLLEQGADEQFVAPLAEEAWQASRDRARGMLSACDPANPFGSIVAWPDMSMGYRPQRTPGARILIHNGRLAAYLTRSGRSLHTPRSISEPGSVIQLLKRSAEGPIYLESINGAGPYDTPWHEELVAAGFSPSRRGYLLRTRIRSG